MTPSSSFPELSVGPQDPDATSELTGKLGTHNKAGRLLVKHARNYPAELRRLLALPADPDRTEVAQDYREEIEEAARSVKGRSNFLPDDAEVVEVSVFGDPAGKERVFAILYRVSSGRTARGVISFDAVEEVEEDYQERLAAGDFAPQPQGADASQALVRELLAALQRGDTAEVVASDDAETQEAIAELTKRLEEAEGRAAEAEAAAEEASAPKPPFEDYEEGDANAVVKRLKEEGISLLGANGLRAVVDYENAREGGPRKTVVSAAEELAEEAEAGPPSGDE